MDAITKCRRQTFFQLKNPAEKLSRFRQNRYTRLTPNGTNDIVLSSFNYTNGPLGNFTPDELANFSRLAEVNLGELQPPRTNDRSHVFMRSSDGRWQTILDRQGRLLKVRHVTGENPQDEMAWKHKAAPEANLPWSEAQALAKTRSLLEGLGQPPVVARTEYEAEPWHVRNKEGKPATTVPFHTVRFYDTNDILLIQAEYQAGPDKIKRSAGSTISPKNPSPNTLRRIAYSETGFPRDRLAEASVACPCRSILERRAGDLHTQDRTLSRSQRDPVLRHVA